MVDEEGRPSSLGPLTDSAEGLRAFAAGLRFDDRLALEASSNTWAIAELLADHVGEVVVSNPVDHPRRRADHGQCAGGAHR